MLSNLWKIRTSPLFHLPCWLTFLSLKLACYHIRRSQLSWRSGYKHVPNYSKSRAGYFHPDTEPTEPRIPHLQHTVQTHQPQPWASTSNFHLASNFPLVLITLGGSHQRGFGRKKMPHAPTPSTDFGRAEAHAFELCSSPHSCQTQTPASPNPPCLCSYRQADFLVLLPSCRFVWKYTFRALFFLSLKDCNSALSLLVDVSFNTGWFWSYRGMQGYIKDLHKILPSPLSPAWMSCPPHLQAQPMFAQQTWDSFEALTHFNWNSAQVSTSLHSKILLEKNPQQLIQLRVQWAIHTYNSHSL